MKTVLILIGVCVLALPATAEGWVHRMRVPAHEVGSWETPQWFAWTDPTVFKIKVNGHLLTHGYKYERTRDCGLGWSARQAVVEAQMPCQGRSPVTIEAANLRDVRMRVRVSYWDPRQRVAKDDKNG